MDVAQITAALDQVFNDQQVRIVFWNDPDGEFAGSLPGIALEGVEVLKLDEVGALEAKVRIEQEDPAGRFLLYSPAEEPDYENDWLLGHAVVQSQFPGRPRFHHPAGTRLGSPVSSPASCKAPEVF